MSIPSFCSRVLAVQALHYARLYDPSEPSHGLARVMYWITNSLREDIEAAPEVSKRERFLPAVTALEKVISDSLNELELYIDGPALEEACRELLKFAPETEMKDS